MKCKNCGSERVASITAKCADCCGTSIGEYDKSDYVPGDMGVGGGDYVEFDWCLECGQIQGEWPLEKCKAEEFDPKACEECGETDYFDEVGECGNCGHKKKMWCPCCENQAYFTKLTGLPIRNAPITGPVARCDVEGYGCLVSITDLKNYNAGM